MSSLQKLLKLSRVTALDEIAVRIVALWQRDCASCYTVLPKAARKRFRGTLTTAVPIGIKSQVDGSRTVAELAELARIEIGAHRAGDVVETGLPQCSVVEQALDQNHFQIFPDLVPCVQPAFGSRQKTVRRHRGRQAAAIEVVFQRKHDATGVGVIAGGGYQTGLTQQLQRIAQLDQRTSQAAAGRVTNPHMLDHFRRADSALVQVGNRLPVTV